MLHWSVSSSIFYYTQLFCGLWLMCYSGATGWEEKERQSSTFFYDAKKELEMLLRWKGWNQQEEYHPFFFKLLKQIFFFFGQNATQHLQTIFVCVPTFHLFLSDGVQFQQKLFVCNFASYLSVNIYSSSTFSYVSLAWWYPTLCPLKSSLKWLVSGQTNIFNCYI